MAIGFVVYGSGSNTVEVPVSASYHCAACSSVTAQRLLLNYEFIHLFVWFRDVNKQRYLTACTRCGAVRELMPEEAKVARDSVKSNPIPLRDRYGGVKLILLVGGFILSLNLLDSLP
jgi:hypothetical protein